MFDGGFTLEAAEEIASAPGAEIDVLRGLESLLDKSLLRIRRDGGDARFERLRTIRAFSVEKLEESGEADRWRRRHAEWFAGFADQFNRAGVPALESREALERLEQEMDNLRAALHWAVDRGEASLALRLCNALPAVWFMGGDSEEVARWLERVQGLWERLDPRERAVVLSLRGRLAQVLGDNSPAVVEAFQESLELFRSVGDERGIARSLMSLGNIHRRRGDFDVAEELFDQSLVMYRRLGDRANEGGAMLNLGDLYTARGEIARARSILETAVELARSAGSPFPLGYALGYLGSAAYGEGRFDEAERHYREALEAFRTVGAGEISQAWMICGLASLERERGSRDRARELFAEALAAFLERGYRPGIAYVLVGRAAIAAEEGRHEVAARLLGAADGIEREAFIAAPSSEEVARRVARERSLPALGEARFAELRAEGARLSADEAVALLAGA